MFFSENREKLFSIMKDNSVAIIHTNRLQQRSNDTSYPFRPHSNFYYLTGFVEDQAIIVLKKYEGKEEVTLFVHPKDPLKEMWDGKRLGVEKALEKFEATKTFAYESFVVEVTELLKGTQTLYAQDHDSITKDALTSSKQARESHLFPLSIEDVDVLVLTLRRKKRPYEIEMVREALKLTEKAHHAAMAMATPSKKEYEIMALVEYIFKSGGATSDAYTTIVAGGNSANVLHYIENNRRLCDGDLILMDAGSEFNYYASDITRSFPVNGKFSTPQKELYELILTTQKEAIEAMKPGVLRSDLTNRAIRSLSSALQEIGMFKEKSLDEVVEKELYKPYFPHGLGHWMGLDVHDPVAYKSATGEEYAFLDGDILTIEPGLYLDASDETVPKAFRGIGIRIEDDILITTSGHENLSQAIAKEVKDIEERCQMSLYDYI